MFTSRCMIDHQCMLCRFWNWIKPYHWDKRTSPSIYLTNHSLVPLLSWECIHICLGLQRGHRCTAAIKAPHRLSNACLNTMMFNWNRIHSTHLLTVTEKYLSHLLMTFSVKDQAQYHHSTLKILIVTKWLHNNRYVCRTY